jgi:ABC-type phosphate transport system ATPase subunit
MAFLVTLCIAPLFAMENKLVVYEEELVAKESKCADEMERYRNKKYNINKFPLHSNKKQNLVIMGGTANCGKSSLCKALNTLDSSYRIISQDDIHRKVTYEICDNIFPVEMAIIRKAIKYENMWRAIRCFDVLCIEETNEQEMECVIGAIKHIRDYFDDPVQEKQMIAMLWNNCFFMQHAVITLFLILGVLLAGVMNWSN